MATDMTGFKRSLTLLDAVMLVAGSMIGSGIFIVSADMLRQLGSPAWMITAWVVSGVMTVLAALSYGELAAMMPKAGGQYVYIQRAFGRLPAFMYGWTVFTVIQTGLIAAVAVAFAKYTAVFVPALGEGVILLDLGFLQVNASQLVAIASVVLLTAFNARGVRNGKLLQTSFTLAKIIALLGLIAAGLWLGGGTGVWSTNFSGGWEATGLRTAADGTEGHVPLSGLLLVSAFGVALVGSLFSSDAWNNVTFIAGEIDRPQRNIPLGLVLGTALVTVLYLLANFAYLALLPTVDIQHALADRVGAAAAAVIFGDQGALIMAGLIMVSTFGCNNGIILSGARLYYAMAQDGLFFRRAGELNKAAVPGFALWVQCVWASLLCLSGRYGDLLEYTMFASLLFYIVTIAGLFVLRVREPHAQRPYRAWGYPVLPAIYILAAAAFCINLLWSKPLYTGFGLGIVALGAVVYAAMPRRAKEAGAGTAASSHG
ncbi:MAG: amino acid permease [Flavobacteriales bacterium]|nr:amino acid permease [Flavobacteriales bacterium]MBP9079254.1 amino acid permease [Flavobacteriales bacterium]